MPVVAARVLLEFDVGVESCRAERAGQCIAMPASRRGVQRFSLWPLFNGGSGLAALGTEAEPFRRLCTAFLTYEHRRWTLGHR